MVAKFQTTDLKDYSAIEFKVNEDKTLTIFAIKDESVPFPDSIILDLSAEDTQELLYYLKNECE